MPVNAVASFEAHNDGSMLIVEATTFLPAEPKLLTFCCGYRLLPKKRKRGGEDVPHGNLLYLDCTPKEFNPVGAPIGTAFRWEVPNAAYLPCKDCHLAIVEFVLHARIAWSTQVHPCPPAPVPAVGFNGATTFTGGAQSGPTPFLSVSYWLRLVNGSQFNPFWEANYLDEQESIEFMNGLFTPYVQLYEWTDPLDPPPTPGRLAFESAAPMSVGEWHHVCWQVNTAAKSASLLIDRINVTQIDLSEGDSFDINSHGGAFVYGGDGFGSDATFEISELWLAFGQAVNFDDPAVLDLFVTPDLKPVDLGPNGELPTGVPPSIFGHGDASTFLQPNLGTGGGLALSGALYNVPDGPGA